MSPPQTALPWPCVSVDPPTFLLSGRRAKIDVGLPLCEAPWESWLLQVLPATLGGLYYLVPSHRWVDWGAAWFGHLPKVTQLADTRGKIWTQTVWLQNLTCNHEQHQSQLSCVSAFLPFNCGVSFPLGLTCGPGGGGCTDCATVALASSHQGGTQQVHRIYFLPDRPFPTSFLGLA